MTMEPETPDVSPDKKETITSKPPSMVIINDELVINGSKTVKIIYDVATLPDDLPNGFIHRLRSKNIPLGLTLRYNWAKKTKIPLNGFNIIEIENRDDGDVEIRLLCEYSVQISSETFSIEMWKSIINAAIEIHMENTFNDASYKNKSSDGKINCVVAIRGDGVDIEELEMQAIGFSNMVETLISAFHLTVCQQYPE